jgi:hypothetical protein
MRSPVLLLPSLLLPLFALAIWAPQRASQIPATKTARDTEISQLQQQLDATSSRLTELQASGHQFVPR